MEESIWHYPKEDNKDLPRDNSTVVVAMVVDGERELRVYENVWAKTMLHWCTRGICYAWRYIDVPPLKKNN